MQLGNFITEEYPIISDINTHFQEVILAKTYSQLATWRETAAAATNSLPHSMALSASEGIQVMYYFTTHFHVKTR